jgi:hypothetical protein
MSSSEHHRYSADCSVGGAAFTSLFLARPNAKLSDIPRHPVHVASPEECLVCHIDRDEDDPLECEKVCSPTNPLRPV